MLVNLIKSYRQLKEISQRKLAKEIGIPHTVLNRFEKDQEISQPHWVAIVRWALVGKN